MTTRTPDINDQVRAYKRQKVWHEVRTVMLGLASLAVLFALALGVVFTFIAAGFWYGVLALLSLLVLLGVIRTRLEFRHGLFRLTIALPGSRR